MEYRYNVVKIIFKLLLSTLYLYNYYLLFLNKLMYNVHLYQFNKIIQKIKVDSLCYYIVSYYSSF